MRGLFRPFRRPRLAADHQRWIPGVATVITAAVLWGWMGAHLWVGQLSVWVAAAPCVLVALGTHLLLGGDQSGRLSRWVPLLTVFITLAALVFLPAPAAQGSGLLIATLCVLLAPWLTDDDSVAMLGVITTATFATLLTVQAAPPSLVVAAIVPAACGGVIWTMRRQVRRLHAGQQLLIERLNLALSQGQAGSFDIDLDTGESHYSPRFREVLGYDGFSTFPPLPPLMECDELVWHEDTETLARAVSHARRSGALIDEEVRFVNAAGQPMWVRLRAIPRSHGSQRVNRLSGTILDLSAKRDAEDMTEAFLLAASRQIRAPLTSIRGVHRLLRSGAFGSLPELAERMVDIADRNGAHLEHLVDCLMDLRRIQHRPQPFDLEPTCLPSAVHQAVEAANQHYGHVLDISAPETASNCIVQADARRLTAAVQALLCVASDHLSGQTAVACTVAQVDGRIDLTVVRTGDAADDPLNTSMASLLTSEEEPPVDDTDSLMLAVARARLRAMGAWIRAQASSGGKLQVRVTFPRCEMPMEQPTQITAEQAS